MPRDTQQQKSLTRRAVMLGGGQALLASALAGGSISCRSSNGTATAVMADENRINLRLIAPPRGRILDRFGVGSPTTGRPIASSLVPEQTGDIAATLDAVGDADRR